MSVSECQRWMRAGNSESWMRRTGAGRCDCSESKPHAAKPDPPDHRTRTTRALLDLQALQNIRDRVGRLRADAQPILHPVALHGDLLLLVLGQRIIVSEVLKDLAVPLGPRVRGHDAIGRQVLPARLLQAQVAASWVSEGDLPS